MNNDFPQLKLENQICFPLYACSKELVRRYAPLLEPYKLTYTHYIAMMVIWEKGSVTVSELGSKLFLDSGTLTPVLKKLESHGYITRERSTEDERCVMVCPTEAVEFSFDSQGPSAISKIVSINNIW